MRTENEMILTLTVPCKDLEVIISAANIEEEFIEDYIKDTILVESMKIVKRKEQEDKK